MNHKDIDVLLNDFLREVFPAKEFAKALSEPSFISSIIQESLEETIQELKAENAGR